MSFYRTNTADPSTWQSRFEVIDISVEGDPDPTTTEDILKELEELKKENNDNNG